MYHGVVAYTEQVPLEREAGAELYDVDVNDFREQVRLISKEAYVPTRIAHARENPQSVVITFDDGEFNNFQNAWPVLRDYKFPAYFFVTVSRVGKAGYMNWEQLRELRDTNMIIGSHGLNHDIMTQLSSKQIEKELIESKDILEQHLKIEVADFSVPRGFYNETVIEFAKRSGYRNVFVSGNAKEDSDFIVGRVAVKTDWSLERFKQALKGETPAAEKLGNSVKGVVKNILGGKGYDQLRSGILKFRGKGQGNRE